MSPITSRSIRELLAQNPGFDLLRFDFHRPGATDELNFDDLDQQTSTDALKALQRLLRLYPSEPVAEALYEAGFRSAHEIAALPERRFVREFASILAQHDGGTPGERLARQVHRLATDVVERVRLHAMNLVAMSDPSSSASPSLTASPELINFYKSFPGYEELFGDLNYLQCEECQSIWSPAAYFVDLMRLVDGYITKPKNKALWLNTRRPDLWEIPLDCESTEQEVPYLQIVNRILEAQIKYRLEYAEKKKKGSVESVTPLFYLATRVYPFALPFNEPFTRIREMLKHFDLTLAEVYEAFRVGKGKKDVKGSIAQAMLGVSPEKYAVLTEVNTKDTDSLQQAYGLVQASDTLSDLSTVETFLEQTRLRYKQLDELLFENLRRKRVLAFDGTIEVNAGTLDNLHTGFLTGDQTIEMWLYPAYFVNTSYPLAKDAEGEFQVQVVENSGQVTYTWQPSDVGSTQQVLALTLPDLQWSHIAFVRDLKDTETTYAYLNGTLVNSMSTKFSAAASSSLPVAIGETYSGGIADVRIWQTARSAKEIMADMHRRLTGHEAGLVGCWPLDDGVGTTVRDISPYKNYGTIETVSGTGTPTIPEWPLAIDLIWDSNEIQGRILNQFFINQALATINQTTNEPDAQFLVVEENISNSQIMATLSVINPTSRAMWPLSSSHINQQVRISTFDRLNRFIRLAETLGWSFADLDLALRSIEPPNPSTKTATEIDEKSFHGLAAIKKLQSRLGLQVDELCALWSDMNTFGIGNDEQPQDLFDRTYNFPTSFLDPTGEVAVPPYHPYYNVNPLYLEPPIHWQPYDRQTKQNQMIRARLRGSLGLDDISLGLLIDFLHVLRSELIIGIAVSYLGIELLTLLYRYSKLSQSLNLRMDEFLTLLRLLKKPYINSIKTVTKIVWWADWLRASGLTVAQLEYLTTGKKNPWVAPGYNPDAVAPMLQSLFQAATPALVTPTSFIKQRTTNSQSDDSTTTLDESQAAAIYQALQSAAFIDGNGVVLHQPLTPETILTAFPKIPVSDQKPLSKLVIETLLEFQAMQRYLVEQHLAAFFNVSAELMAGTTMLTARTLPSYINLNGDTLINLSTSPAFNPSQFTSCCWVRMNAPTSEKNYLLYAIGTDKVSGYALSLYEVGVAAACQIQIGNNSTLVGYSSDPFPASDWMHLALTLDGTAVVSLYVNGIAQTLKEDSDTPLGTFSPNTTAPVYVGSNGATDFLDGAVAEVRIYNSALTGDQLTKVMYQTAGRIEPFDEGLVGYWPLNAGGGAYAYDAAGKGSSAEVQRKKSALEEKGNSKGKRNSGEVANSPDWVNYYPGSLLFDLPEGEPVPANAEELIAAHALNLYLAGQLRLNPVEVLSLAERPAPFGINGFGFGFRFSLDDIRIISLYKRLTAAFDDTGAQLLSYFQLASDTSVPLQAEEKLARISGWPVSQIATLEGQDFWPPDCKFDTVEQVASLKQCFDQAEALGADIDLMLGLRGLNTLNLGAPGNQPSEQAWNEYQTISHNLSQAINSKYGANVAPQVLDSILGKLEELKRDILVAFLLWALSFEFDDLKTSDDLYDFLLIDVDMSSVVQISPLKAGLNSLQLYVQSAQMNLEAGTLDEIPRLWWSWMQNYRVWQANREVFLYPENYVNPALRRFKTPQFAQLETSLQQGNVTPEMADSALTNYLEGMATVANLKIISSYRAQVKKPGVNPGEVEEIDTVFIFGRTRTDPATFYYRTLRITDKINPEKGVWTAWQQINLSINAEEITPIYAFEKLYIFWVEQTQKTVNISSNNTQQSVQITTASIYYSFQKLDRSWIATQTLEKDLVIGVNPSSVTETIGLLQRLEQPASRSSVKLPTQPEMPVWKKVRAMFLPSFESQAQIVILYGDYVAPSLTTFTKQPPSGNLEIDAFNQMLDEAVEVNQALQKMPGNVTTIAPAWAGGGNQAWQRATIELNPETTNYCTGCVTHTGGAQIGYFQTNNVLLCENLPYLTKGPLVAYFPLNDGASNSGATEIRDVISGNKYPIKGTLKTDYAWVPSTGAPFGDRIVLQCMQCEVAITTPPADLLWDNFTVILWMNLNNNNNLSQSIISLVNKNVGNWGLSTASGKVYCDSLEFFSQAGSPQIAIPQNDPWTWAAFQCTSRTNPSWGALYAYSTSSTNDFESGMAASPFTEWDIWSTNNGTTPGMLASLSLWSADFDENQISDFANHLISLINMFPLLEAGVSPLLARIEPVGNQPGWFTFDNGDEAFLVVPQDDPFYQLESIITAKTSPAPGTGPRKDLPVLSLSFGDAAIDPTKFDFTSLTLQFIRLTTAVVQDFEQKLLMGGPETLLTWASQYADELPFSRYKPTANVGNPQPSAHLDFNGSFGEYFWELFFYAPFLIADTYATNQKFQLAQKWYQYIFNPTPTGVVQQFGYWPMDEGTGDTFYDHVGADNATIVATGGAGVNSWTTDPPCPLGANRWVVSLNATDYVQIDDIYLPDSNGPMTISFWIKATSAGSQQWQNILYYAPSPSVTFVVGIGFGSTPSLTTQSLWFWSSASGETWYSGPSLSQGWNHVVVTLKNASGSEPGYVYVNGVKSAFTSNSTSNTFETSLLAGQMFIGWEGAQYAPIVGMITDLQIWDVALSEETIQQIKTGKPKQADRFWRFRPFLNQTPESLKAELNSQQQLVVYEYDPFDPDALARLRSGAYEKGIVMRYVENLIKWGNNLFAQYTWETITEAAMFYTEALNLLGSQPRQVGDFPAPPVKTVLDFVKEYGGAAEIPEFLIQLEHDVTNPLAGSGIQLPAKPFNLLNSYFCVPVNKRLLAMWHEVDNHLYKIRHGENIKGQPQPLPLFQPPLAPGKLVKAGVRGLSGASRPPAGSPNIPYYRFSYLIQQAKDFTSQVIQLGSSLLAALEKQDAEQLALIQNSNEAAILNLTTEIKQNQIEQLEQSGQALAASLSAAQLRLQTYNSWMQGGAGTSALQSSGGNAQGGGGWSESLLPAEKSSLKLLRDAFDAHLYAASIRVISSPLYLLPNIFGMSDGGMEFGKSMEAVAGASDSVGGVLGIKSQLAGMVGQFQRRDQDWLLQSELASDDITQIQAQIAANQSALASAQRDLQVHQEQITQNHGIGNFYRTKFTSEQLYEWMAGRLSTIYFQSYQLAFELAQDAQTAFQYENNSERNYLNYGAWDNLEKGLTAGDSLMLSLNQLEKANIDAGVRHLEIEKTISLLQLNPQAVLDLKSKGSCSFDLTEQLFDYDFPGHYNRKIKTISVTIPAIVGPYQNIHASLTQTASRVVTQPDIKAVEYLLPGGDKNGGVPQTIRSNWNANQQVALSRGNNDSGLFVLNFDDPRYLPFEGTGAISNWTLEMYKAANAVDFNTISDVIIQLSYTAQDGGEAFQQAVTSKDAVSQFYGLRYLSLRQAFPEAWHNFIHPTSGNPTIKFPITRTMFPPNLEPNSILLGTPKQIKNAPVGTIAVEWLTADGDSSGLPALTLNGQPVTLSPSHSELWLTQLVEPETAAATFSQVGLDSFGISNPNLLTANGAITEKMKVIDIVLIIPFNGPLSWPSGNSSSKT